MGIPLEKAMALKEWCPEIYEYCIMAGTINHINHQPEHDNYVCLEDQSKDKIEYVTPGENTQKAKVHYGGSTELAPQRFLSGEHDAGKDFIDLSKPIKTILSFVEDDTIKVCGKGSEDPSNGGNA